MILFYLLQLPICYLVSQEPRLYSFKQGQSLKFKKCGVLWGLAANGKELGGREVGNIFCLVRYIIWWIVYLSRDL